MGRAGTSGQCSCHCHSQWAAWGQTVACLSLFPREEARRWQWQQGQPWYHGGGRAAWTSMSLPASSGLWRPQSGTTSMHTKTWLLCLKVFCLEISKMHTRPFPKQFYQEKVADMGWETYSRASTENGSSHPEGPLPQWTAEGHGNSHQSRDGLRAHGWHTSAGTSAGTPQGPVVTHIRAGTPPTDSSRAMPMHWFIPTLLRNGFQGGQVPFSPQKCWIDEVTLPMTIQHRESFNTRRCAAWNIGFLSSWLAESEASERKNHHRENMGYFIPWGLSCSCSTTAVILMTTAVSGL